MSRFSVFNVFLYICATKHVQYQRICISSTLTQITMCAEQENQATEGATQQEDVSGSYQLMQQQLKQASETIATSMEQLSRVQPTTSQLIIVQLFADHAKRSF